MPAKMHAAPATAFPVNRSSATKNDVSHANTGSSENISAALVAVVCFCAHVCAQNAAAVARSAVTPSAMSTDGLHVTNDLSNHQKLLSANSAQAPTCSSASQSDSIRCEVWPSTTMCPANATAQPTVSRSPSPIRNDAVSRVKSASPPLASAIPAHSDTPG